MRIPCSSGKLIFVFFLCLNRLRTKLDFRVNDLPFALCIFLLVVFLFPSFLLANNLSIENVELVDLDSTEETIVIEFNVSWSNAWKDSVNNDAVWIFCKFSPDEGATWYHATMKTAGTNPSGTSGGVLANGAFRTLDVIVPADKKGAFLQPQSNGTGLADVAVVRLVWDYGDDGWSQYDVIASQARIKVFGIEMVYVPTEGFYAGDGNTGSGCEFQYGGSATGEPAAVVSEEGISFTSSSAGGWYYTSGGNSGEAASGSTFWLGSAFPKGYHGFYLMKYEVSQGQYADFLNTLTSTQATNRFPNQNGNNRHTISGAYASYAATRPDRACNWISWMDLAAYADWAALRPITELEFEKACRGPLYPVANEYAWGNTTITAAAAISGSENGTETVSTSNANCVYNNQTFTGGDGGSGPVRAGIFATASTVTRQTTGAGYYGNMELSGNVWERTVTVGNAMGRGFAGTHGDGTLATLTSYEGNATNPDWPGISSTPSQGVTTASGSGFRGGHFASSASDISTVRVSWRASGASTNSGRSGSFGGRLARTSPD